MLEFDLVPADYRAALRTQRWLKITGLALAAIIGLTVVARIAISWATYRVQQSIAQTEQQIQAGAAAQKVLSQLKTDLESLKSETTFSASLARGPDPVIVLTALDKAISDQLWFDRVEIVRTRDKANDGSAPPPGLVLASLTHKKIHWRLGSTVKFTGHAVDHGAISAFIAGLEQSKAVARIELNKSRVRHEGRIDIVDFELTAQIPLSGDPS